LVLNNNHFELLSSIPSVVEVCLGLMTIVWPVAVVQILRMWNHQTTFFDVAGTSNLRYRRARVRTFPMGVLLGGLLLAAAWMFAISPPSQGGKPNVIQVVGLITFLLVVVLAITLLPTIFLFNRPKRLVPPHMRNQLGYFAEARIHRQN
jgi:hypothetical protein